MFLIIILYLYRKAKRRKENGTKLRDKFGILILFGFGLLLIYLFGIYDPFFPLAPVGLISGFLIIGIMLWAGISNITTHIKTDYLNCNHCDFSFSAKYVENKKERKKIYTNSRDFLIYEKHLKDKHPQAWKEYNEGKEKMVMLNQLKSAINVFLTGASSKIEILEDAMWGIFDPMYVMYRKSIGIGSMGMRRISPQEAKDTIKRARVFRN